MSPSKINDHDVILSMDSCWLRIIISSIILGSGFPHKNDSFGRYTWASSGMLADGILNIINIIPPEQACTHIPTNRQRDNRNKAACPICWMGGGITVVQTGSGRPLPCTICPPLLAHTGRVPCRNVAISCTRQWLTPGVSSSTCLPTPPPQSHNTTQHDTPQWPTPGVSSSTCLPTPLPQSHNTTRHVYADITHTLLYYTLLYADKMQFTVWVKNFTPPP